MCMENVLQYLHSRSSIVSMNKKKKSVKLESLNQENYKVNDPVYVI